MEGYSNRSIFDSLDLDFLKPDTATTASPEVVPEVVASVWDGEEWVGFSTALSVVVAVVGLIAAVRKNMELLHRILAQLHAFTTAALRPLRRDDDGNRAAQAPPSIPSPAPTPSARNLTDSVRIEMREARCPRSGESLETTV